MASGLLALGPHALPSPAAAQKQAPEGPIFSDKVLAGALLRTGAFDRTDIRFRVDQNLDF